MVNENQYLIKENYKKVEEVREIENEIPSYEEFMKTYESNEEVEILTEAEYQDRLLHGSQYGPGNEQSKANLAKWGGKIAITTTATLLFPPAGVAIGGATAWGVCKIGENAARDKDAKEIWKWLGDIGGSSALGGVVDWTALKAASKTVDELKYVCNALDKSKDKAMLEMHIKHLEIGINHLSGCEVCEA